MRELQNRPPEGGHQKGVTPICSDSFRFSHILSLGIPRFPISSDLLPEQIRTNQGTPFCRPLSQVPEGRIENSYLCLEASRPNKQFWQSWPKLVLLKRQAA